MQRVIIVLIVLLCANTLSAQSDSAELCAHIDEITVTGLTGDARKREIAVPMAIVSAEGLKSHASTTIMDALARQSGISQIQTGAAIAKPVIRGMGYNRVLVIADGIRQEGQQWGDEHGLEIDKNRVYSAEIIKGPASLIYGSDAMGGVIILKDAPILPEGDFAAQISTNYQTNQGLIDYAAQVRGRQKGIIYDAGVSQQFAHDYRAPIDGKIAGTGFNSHSFYLKTGLYKHWGSSQLKYNFYHIKPEMTELEDWGSNNSYRINSPFQKVAHHKIVWDNSINLGTGLLKATFAYQENHRQEFETPDEAELDFRLQGVHYDLRYVLPSFAGWKTNIGANGMWQRSLNFGEEFLIPAYSLFDAGFFATFSKSFIDKIHLSGGLRYDLRKLHSRELIDDEGLIFKDFSRDFGSLSANVGVVYNALDNLDLRLNLARGFRSPNISELGSNGVHEGTFRYEMGNENLQSETSYQADFGIDFSSKFVSASLAIFANRIANYIFLERTAESIDEMPVFQFNAGDAAIFGGEMRLIFHLLKHLHFVHNFSYVNAQQLNSSAETRYLPFMPAPRYLASLHYDIPLKSQRLQHFFVELEADNFFKQNKFRAAYNTETASDGYSLVNFSIGTDILSKKAQKICSIYLSADNLFDKAYQSHLSRLKYAETFDITGRNGINNIGRNISVKLIFNIGNN